MNLEKTPQLEVVTLEEFESGFGPFKLEIALAVKARKVEPFGYDTIVNLVKANPHPADFILLLSEAELEGRTEEATDKFPSAVSNAMDFITGLVETNPNLVDEITKRINNPNYSLQDAREIQLSSEQTIEDLFKPQD